MWIKKVTAHAFGPLKGEELQLAEGMTVVVGPNESGKSSWHAAIYTGLCGIRARRGAPTKEDRAFRDRYRPWDGDEWRVAAEIELPVGKRFEIHHDLENQVDTWVKDLTLGRNISDITVDGFPDGSRWLGLDRRGFLSVATIRQAEVMSITEHAGALQEYLARAAATSGTDETAAQAITALDLYKSEQVGLRRSNSNRPLQAALNRVRTAEDRLSQANADHQTWLQMVADIVEIDREALTARTRAQAAEAAAALRVADEHHRRYTDAAELSARHPAPPPGIEGDTRLVEQVTTALRDWQQRPDLKPLEGRTAAELEEDLAALPPIPRGDTEPDPQVRAAHRSVNHARERHEAHLAQDPGIPVTADDQTPPAVPDNASPVGGLIFAAFLLLGGAALLANGMTAGGLIALAAGLLLAWGSIRKGQKSGLRSMVAEEVASNFRESREVWSSREKALAATRSEAVERLVAGLRARGVEVPDDYDETRAESLYEGYEEECRHRAKLALASAARPGVEQALAERRRVEADIADDHKRLEEARIGLAGAIEAIAESGTDMTDEEMVTTLRVWQDRNLETLKATDAARSEWSRLQTILDGASLAELEEAATRARERADGLAIDPGLAGTVDLGDDPEATVRSLRTEAKDKEIRAAEAHREIQVREESYVSVAEAEEQLAAARAELGRVETLEEVLETTKGFLVESQERVHNNIAPKLQAKVRDRLTRVTGGRYSDVTVTPETLTVSVRDEAGMWRDASRLSHGTAEQIYLLLRVAMAEVLTTGAACPLILDDVTVHSDGERTVAVLEVLHEVSADHQVILFSQEVEVVEWAKQNLGDRDSLHFLAAV